MKRKSLLLCLILIVSGILAVSVSAGPKDGVLEIKKGTPVVDGVREDIYKQSACYELENLGFYKWGDNEGSDISGDAYLLWDENYIYACFIVKESTPQQATAAYLAANPDNPWQNDAIESWWGDGEAKFKFHTSADGSIVFGSAEPGPITIDVSKATVVSVMHDDGYVIEMALPFSDLQAGREIGFDMQVNDLVTAADDGGSGNASGGQEPASHIYTLSAEEVVYPVVETEAPAPETEAAPADTSAAGSAAAPQTFDVLIAASIAALASAAVIKKRR